MFQVWFWILRNGNISIIWFIVITWKNVFFSVVAFSCLIFNGESLELRLYPSDFKHFSQSELRWPIGNSLKLTCELDGKEKDMYTLVWYLPHSQSRATNISLQDGRSTLWMDGINSNDNGPYECKAEKKLGMKVENIPRVKDKTITLYVSSPSGLYSMYLVFLICRRPENSHQDILVRHSLLNFPLRKHLEANHF